MSAFSRTFAVVTAVYHPPGCTPWRPTDAADAEEADVVVAALRYVVTSVKYDVHRFITSDQFNRRRQA